MAGVRPHIHAGLGCADCRRPRPVGRFHPFHYLEPIRRQDIMSARLSGRTAIVTGAGAGIGRATAELFAAEGARVVVAEINGEAADSAGISIRAAGGQVLVICADVSSSRDAEGVVQQTLEKWGTVDILVNNAGVELKRPVEETSEEDWDRILSVNLKSAFLMSKYVIPVMKRVRRGAIVNNSSVGYFIAAVNSAAYGASKAGMMALTRCTALELAPWGIRVNAVCPGVIDTQMNERNLARAADPEAMRRSWYEITPLGKLGTPADVAKAVLFLASEDAAFITGTPLIIDGGRTAH
ncbi:MAG: SDR family oxidoreductase [Acidobacteria bacterium]|nr:SDR family oxidoreductase [Acidobacteriota bacterium]